MKKYLYSALAACSLFTLGACSADEPVNDGQNGDAVVLNVQMPREMMTRAYGHGTEASTLMYAIYEGNQANPFIMRTIENAFDENLEHQLSLRLVAGKTYNIVFWAQSPNCTAYTFTPSEKTISVVYDNEPAVNATGETRDAFFASRTFTVSRNGDAIQETIILTRPFAQINVGTNDLTEPAVTNLKSLQTSVSVKAYSKLNLLTGEASDEVTATIPFASRPHPLDEEFPVPGNKYTYLSCDYFLMNVGESLQPITLSFRDATEVLNTFTIPDVPMQRNYRTNIYGSLLTSAYDYTVRIDPDWIGGYDVNYTNN